MNKSFNLLFYVKRSKTNAEGLAPIYLHITIDGVRIEVSSKRYVNPDKWNTNEQKLTGNNEEVKSINVYLKTLEHQVYDVHRDMIERKLLITAFNLKDRLLGGKPSPGKMLMLIFREHNRQVAALIGKEYAKGTLDRYETSLKHTQAFLIWKHNATDIRAIDHESIMA